MSNEIGKEIALRRTNLNMTQKELEVASGLSKTTICHYETGRRIPSIESFRGLCKTFKCTLTDLLGF